MFIPFESQDKIELPHNFKQKFQLFLNLKSFHKHLFIFLFIVTRDFKPNNNIQ